MLSGGLSEMPQAADGIVTFIEGYIFMAMDKITQDPQIDQEQLQRAN